MKCDKCDNEATVHEVTMKGGKRSEKHMCEGCARESGMAPAVVVNQPLTQLLTQYITAQSDAAAETATPGASGGAGATAAPTVCPTCAMSYSSFRSTGLLGCPDCYGAFQAQLAPLLARAHEGGTSHVGKTPLRLADARMTDERRGGAMVSATPTSTTIIAEPAQASAKEIAARVATLRRTLAEAVASEQYEKAARIRDELATIEGRGTGASTTDAAAPARPARAKRRAAPGESDAGGTGGMGGTP